MAFGILKIVGPGLAKVQDSALICFLAQVLQHRVTGMKSEQKPFVSYQDASKKEFPRQPIDRRSFLQYAAGVGAMVALGGSVFGQAQNDAATGESQPSHKSGSADSRLPDGTEYVSWEQPLTFSKTYYVDNNSAKADDNGPGTAKRPFRTINKAAQVLQPGERVVIASGTYRECVRPVRGGTGPAQDDQLRGRPGAKVFIKGSEVLKDGWQQESIPVAFRRRAPLARRCKLRSLHGGTNSRATMFPDAYNPFALASVPGRSGVARYQSSRHGAVFSPARTWSLSTANRWSRWSSFANWRVPHLPRVPDFPIPAAPQNGLPPRRAADPSCRRSAARPMRRFWVEDSGDRDSRPPCLEELPPTT